MAKHKQFSEEFKVEAAKLVNENGYPIAQAAKKLGISPSTLHPWVKKYKDSKLKLNSRMFPSAEDELLQLRKENKRLKEEHEILKKAAAPSESVPLFFAVYCQLMYTSKLPIGCLPGTGQKRACKVRLD